MRAHDQARARHGSLCAAASQPAAEGRDFEEANAAAHPVRACLFRGNRGIDVVRPHPGGTRDYTVIHHFADLDARRAFTGVADYGMDESAARSQPSTIRTSREQAGLGGGLTPPEEPSPFFRRAGQDGARDLPGAYPLMSTLQPLPRFAHCPAGIRFSAMSSPPRPPLRL